MRELEPKETGKENSLEKDEKTFYLGFDPFQYCTPVFIRKLPPGIKLVHCFYQIKECNLV